MSVERRYEYLFGRELQDLIAAEPLAWVPLGILEKHGEHLPWGLDALKAHGVCLHVANKLGGVVLPATHLAGVHEPWNPDETIYRRKRAEVGDFYLRAETFRMLLEDTVDGLANIGFKHIVLYTGHYPKLQLKVIRDVAQWANDQRLAKVACFHEPDAMDGLGEHGGQTESSLYMALNGEVRMDQVKPEHRGKLGYYAASTAPVEQWTRQFGEHMLTRITAYFTKLVNEWRGSDKW